MLCNIDQGVRDTSLKDKNESRCVVNGLRRQYSILYKWSLLAMTTFEFTFLLTNKRIKVQFPFTSAFVRSFFALTGKWSFSV